MLKICGLTEAEEVMLLDSLKVHLGGLWCGIPKGRHNLSVARLKHLANIPTTTLRCVLVTFEDSFATLRSMITDTSLFGIQLHGFQMPALVSRISDYYGDNLKIFKVLHLDDSRCLEYRLIERYLEAGVDYFILDTFRSREQLGSTGLTIGRKTIETVIPEKIDRLRVFIAGGVGEDNIMELQDLFNPLGFDIDTSVREAGTIRKECVASLLEMIVSGREGDISLRPRKTASPG